MSERANRFIIGFCLISFLFLDWNYGVYAIIFVLVFEGLTNWRIPMLITRLSHSIFGIPLSHDTIIDNNPGYKYKYEAERVTRFTVATTICLGFILFRDLLWFLPYLVGLNLLLAGITGLCPLVLLYKKMGFR